MSYYVMSDIHGCFDELMKMLELIQFKKEDTLILAGDYIDRGPKSYEMLKFIEMAPDNVVFIKGNHDEYFSYYVNWMETFAIEYHEDRETEDGTKRVYELIKQMGYASYDELSYFDHERTIGKLLNRYDITIAEMRLWANKINEMPYYHFQEVNGKKYVIVHAGYIENLAGIQTIKYYDSIEDFNIHARDDAYLVGGLSDGTVISGHTPTVIETEWAFNNGDVYKYYDEKRNCTFYDIDCGCAIRDRVENAKLACIRLDDEKIFYV